jgi:DNA-binding transcriptional LysR family regulator
VPTPTKAFLPVAISQLVKAQPKIFVSVVEAQERALVEQLRKREIELAIFRFALSHPLEDLHVDVLFEEHLCVLARKDHPLAARRSLQWRELLGYPWVMPPASSPFIQAVRRSFDEHGLEFPRAVVESSSISFQFGMAVHGAMLSFGLRPHFAFPASQDVMVQLPVVLPVIAGTTGAVRLRARQPSPLAQQLVATIRAMIAGL